MQTQKLKASEVTNTKVPNSLESLKSLERQLQVITMQVRQELAKIDKNINDTNMALNAVINVVGKEEVMTTARELRRQDLESTVAREEADLQAKLDQGSMKAVETVTHDDNMVVTTETNKEGAVLAPSKVFLPLKFYDADIAKLLMNTCTGANIAMPNGNSLKVLNIYDVVAPNKEAV